MATGLVYYARLYDLHKKYGVVLESTPYASFVSMLVCSLSLVVPVRSLSSPISLPGVSPFLIAAEAFKCPSRIARLCEAFYSYAYHSKQHLPYVQFYSVNELNIDIIKSKEPSFILQWLKAC